MSKGSLQRPYDREKWEYSWERIFGNKPTTNEECALGNKCVDDCSDCSIGWKRKDPKHNESKCDRVNQNSESCEFCKRNPDAVEIQSRFFCPERGEPLDG